MSDAVVRILASRAVHHPIPHGTGFLFPREFAQRQAGPPVLLHAETHLRGQLAAYPQRVDRVPQNDLEPAFPAGVAPTWIDEEPVALDRFPVTIPSRVAHDEMGWLAVTTDERGSVHEVQGLF